MKRFGLGVLMIGLMGCGTGSIISDPEAQKESGVSNLQKFRSDGELVSYFQRETSRQQAARFNDALGGEAEGGLAGSGVDDSAGAAPAPGAGAGGGSVDGAPSQGADADGVDFSGTTIQEEGVDEADVVKTDGEYLYVIDGGFLRILDVRSADAISEVSRVELEGYGQDIFLAGSRIVALTQQWNWFYSDMRVMMDGMGAGGSAGVAAESGMGVDDGGPGSMQGPSVALAVIDVTDRAAPAVISTTRFEGNLVSSRMIEDRLHLALAIFPHDFGRVFPLGAPTMKNASLKASDIIPDYEHVDASGAKIRGDLLSWGDVYHPVDPDGFGMVSVISLDIDSAAQFHAVGIMANPGLTYASLNAFYLTDTEWTFWGDERETTDIYKFSYVGTGVELSAVGSIQGRVLNSYSMSEHNGNLRVATTTMNWTGEQLDSANHLYVLGQNADKLDVLGKVENLAPGESIQAVRFVGDRGYLVTFEQIDPLFTLDLSNPADPKVIGELKVPGFSTFIVPMDATHLLTVGQYIAEGDRWSTGVQLSIFDVSDFAAPRLQHQAVIDEGAWSEALWNPKAFTYFADAGVLALPVTVPNVVFFDSDFIVEEGDDSAGEPPIWDPPVYQDKFQGLVVYRVGVDAGFSEVLRLDTRLDGDEGWFWFPAFTRGVFIDSRVYAVTSFGVIGGSLENPQEPGPSLKFEWPQSGEDGVYLPPMPW